MYLKTSSLTHEHTWLLEYHLNYTISFMKKQILVWVGFKLSNWLNTQVD